MGPRPLRFLARRGRPFDVAQDRHWRLLLRQTESGSFLYIYDANGNIGQLVDAADGEIAAHYEYDPFGNLLTASGPEADNNPFRFSTKYLDTETGLYYYGYRYYLPELGRWINRDPIGEKGGLNLYGFVQNNPLYTIDILGLYTYLGADFHHGIEQSDGAIGTVKAGEYIISHIARTIGDPTFEVETSVSEDGCQCCVVRVEFFFGQNVYLPLVGESFSENSLGPIQEITVDAVHLEILTRHENAHVEAEKRIAKTLFEKAESDFKGACWSKWLCNTFKRSWDQTECHSYASKKIKKIVDPHWTEKTDEAERKLNQYRALTQSGVNDYIRWINDRCSSWQGIQFIEKEEGDACQ